jgi:hypothetical protein
MRATPWQRSCSSSRGCIGVHDTGAHRICSGNPCFRRHGFPTTSGSPLASLLDPPELLTLSYCNNNSCNNNSCNGRGPQRQKLQWQKLQRQRLQWQKLQRQKLPQQQANPPLSRLMPLPSL